MTAFRLHFVGLYVALGNEFEFGFFGAWAAVVVGVVRKSRQMPSSAVQQIAMELDPPAVVSVCGTCGQQLQQQQPRQPRGK